MQRASKSWDERKREFSEFKGRKTVNLSRVAEGARVPGWRRTGERYSLLFTLLVGIGLAAAAHYAPSALQARAELRGPANGQAAGAVDGSASGAAPLSAASTLTSTSRDDTQTPIGVDPELPEIIDAHTHTDFGGEVDAETGIRDSRDEYLRQMHEAGITGAVAHTTRTLGGYDETLHSQHNVVYCAGVEARPDVAKVEAGLKSGRFNCIKIYLGYVYQYAYDPAYEPAYRLAEKYNVPVVFHTGDTSTHNGKVKYADPLTIDEVAVDHPKVTFVIAHCGNPWIQSAAEVAYKNPNVYLECSAMLIGNLAKSTPEAIERHLVQPIQWIWSYIENPKKLMYGTDWPLVRMKDYLEVYKRAIPREHWHAVFHDNAARIFRLR